MKAHEVGKVVSLMRHLPLPFLVNTAVIHFI